MQEVSTPQETDIPRSWNCSELLERQAASPENPPLFSVRTGEDGWRDISASEFRDLVVAHAKGLVAQGIKPGDRIGIMANTRFEWVLMDFAIWYAGAVSVPVYESSSPSQVAWILEDSGAVGIVVEGPAHENIVRHAATSASLKDLNHIWQMDDDGLAELVDAGRDVPDEEIASRRGAATLDDLATIIYSSGTTGRPKGCRLTHGNFVLLSESAREAIPEVARSGARTIMFLPLAHVFARYISVLAVHAGVVVAHTPDIKNLLTDLQSYSPDFLLVVPRVFEKVYNGAAANAEASGRGKIFNAAVATAIAYSKARQDGRVGLGLRARHALFDALVYRKLRTAMGGRVTHAVSGGGPLGERLGHFFSGVGILILEGYGLTETTAPVSVGAPSSIKIGTVGLPLPGNSVWIAEDGEILVKGVCVFEGYHNRPDLTEEAFEDGWFRTGDVGTLDEDGFLRITGRKKEILVTAGGKNVVPGLLEDVVRAKPLVSQCLVVGDNRPFVAALVTLDSEVLPDWLKRKGLPSMTPAEAAQNKDVRAEVESYIATANETVSRAESIRAFEIVEDDFTEESGHLTPSLKIKRAKVIEDYDDVVERIYAQKKPTS
ncbi:long-chain fatty acid--CoA ligase [Falsarthrobacter nasiphocae]|uniref:Long-chain acyl-CoA synthetase n=1 Tax=Falsarthrobacter nasiphocae TaxID=189863 RepID=A0AAE4C5B9_9MICC|nr:long-chain fatty acid--CoA ligase [Falsarthrobacter nasiphocae]MDR6891338.1 long-chain acyl-CoA synthetase [Falsarthrobacter nasiphocae]